MCTDVTVRASRHGSSFSRHEQGLFVPLLPYTCEHSILLRHRLVGFCSVEELSRGGLAHVTQYRSLVRYPDPVYEIDLGGENEDGGTVLRGSSEFWCATTRMVPRGVAAGFAGREVTEVGVRVAFSKGVKTRFVIFPPSQGLPIQS